MKGLQSKGRLDPLIAHFRSVAVIADHHNKTTVLGVNKTEPNFGNFRPIYTNITKLGQNRSNDSRDANKIRPELFHSFPFS